MIDVRKIREGYMQGTFGTLLPLDVDSGQIKLATADPNDAGKITAIALVEDPIEGPSVQFASGVCPPDLEGLRLLKSFTGNLQTVSVFTGSDDGPKERIYAVALHSDGSREDVSAFADYSSNQFVAEIDKTTLSNKAEVDFNNGGVTEIDASFAGYYYFADLGGCEFVPGEPCQNCEAFSRRVFVPEELRAPVYSLEALLLDADVTNDQIQLRLWPSVVGTLLLQLTGPQGTHTIRQVPRVGGDSFTILETFDIPNLADKEFTQVKASWTFNGKTTSDTLAYHIRVLGNYRHSRYNTPDESQCTGTSQQFRYTGPGSCGGINCAFQTTSGKSGWLAQVDINGHGHSSALGYVSKERQCTQIASPRLRELNPGLVGCPACSGLGLGVNQTVAVVAGHSFLSCGDQVYVHQVGIRTVTDTGNLPNGQSQLDHYSGLGPCTGLTDIGNRKTIKLF